MWIACPPRPRLPIEPVISTPAYVSANCNDPTCLPERSQTERDAAEALRRRVPAQGPASVLAAATNSRRRRRRQRQRQLQQASTHGSSLRRNAPPVGDLPYAFFLGF